MKRIAIVLIAVVVFATGCRKEKTASQQLDQVQEEAEAAAEDMQDYAFAQKSEFIEKMQVQLDEINRELDKLAAKTESASDEIKAEAKPKLQKLRDQMAKLKRNLDEAANADESAWGDIKSGFKKGYGEMKDGFNNARRWTSDKIAP